MPWVSGVFQITLNLSGADFHIIFDGQNPVWLQVRDVTNNVTYPRQKFSTVPYALKIPADEKFFTYNVDGELTLAATGGGANKFLKMNGVGDLVWEAIPPSNGDMLGSNNLSEIANQAAARNNLGLKGAAVLDVGSIAGTVAAGDHNHNISGLTGAGGLATKNAVGSADITDGSVTSSDIANGTITDEDINATANISYLKISGLGSAASKSVGTGAGDVAAGNHTHTMSAITDAGGLATKSAVGSAEITDNSIANADIHASAAIAGSKINPDFGAQNVTTTGNVTGAVVQANSNLKIKSTNANTITMQSPAALGAGYTLTLPANDGASGEVLTTDGDGLLSWSTVSGGGGGDMFKADNLSGLTNTTTARNNLGLGGLSTLSAVGSAQITDGSVSSADIADNTITDADISSSAAISPSKISGLGGLATKSSVGSADITDGSVTSSDIADGTITDADINATANISYLKISGLGSAASKSVGTGAGDVAAGNHTHTMSAITDAGGLATKSAVGSAEITDNSIANADIHASAAIAGSKINPDFGAQNITTTGNVTGAVVQANSNLKIKSTNANTITMQSPAALGAGYTLTLPVNDGASGEVLTTDGSGGLSWATAATGDMLKSDNLSGLGNTSTARTNLGLGSLATLNTIGSAQITDGSVSGDDIANGTITDADINATANISYLKISGLGSAASKNVGTGAGDVAAGNHTHTMSAITDAGGLATKSAVGSAEITDNSIANADIHASAAIAGSKINPDFGAQNITTTGNVTGAVVQGNTSLRMKSDNANTVELKAPTGLSGNLSLTMPATAGSSGQFLSTNGSGTLSWGSAGGTANLQAKAANFSVTSADAGTTFIMSNAITASLPTAASAGNGFLVTFKRLGGNAHACIQPSGAETIDGTNAVQCIHKQYGFVSLMSNGSEWLSTDKDGFGTRGYRYYRFFIAEDQNRVTNNGHCVGELYLWIDGKKATNAMTSNTAGSIGTYTNPTISAQSEFSASYKAFRAFNGSDISEWEGVWSDVSSSYSSWVKVDFGAGNTPYISGYDVIGQSDDSTNSCGSVPSLFRLEGSTDNSNWTTIPGSTMQANTNGFHAITFFDW